MKIIFSLIVMLGSLFIESGIAEELISHGRFKNVTLYRPDGDVKSFVLLLSGENGLDQKVAKMANVLVDEGAMVAGIDLPEFIANIEADSAACVFPDGDLENLSHYIQAYAKLPQYFKPLLVGYSSGATFVYAMLAQAPSETFSGAISLGFCNQLNIKKQLCRGDGLQFTADKKGFSLLPAETIAVKWYLLQGEQDQLCGFESAQKFIDLTPHSLLIPLPNVSHDFTKSENWLAQFKEAYYALVPGLQIKKISSVSDLPLIEVLSQTQNTDTFAILLSGDGGWAGLDKDVAESLASKGVSVVGWDSLRYFWSARTPETLSADLDRVLRYYTSNWHKKQVILIGYSQGADVLPFAFNRLPNSSKSLVKKMVMMALGKTASFEFHFSNWVDENTDGLPIQPEVEKLAFHDALCIYGNDEAKESLCPISIKYMQPIRLLGGHHFNGDYNILTDTIIAELSNKTSSK